MATSNLITGRMTAVWTMVSLLFVNASLLEKVRGVKAELRDVRNHWHDPVSFDAIPISSLSLEDASDPDSVAFNSNAELEADKESQGVDTPVMRRMAMPQRGPRSPRISLIEEQAIDVQSSTRGGTGSVTCELSFSGRYDEPPTVRIESPLQVSEPAIAILVDENASFWVHGFQGNVAIPSSFIFGSAGTDGEYVEIHPPTGTGKHRYTAIIFAEAPQLGPMLSALYGTPWNNKDRAVGSLDVIETDLERQNGKKPRELCRCSVEVAYEDVKSASS